MNSKIKESFNILQITDTHLIKKNTSRVFGHLVNKNFISVVEKIKREEKIDYIFATGDISNDYSKESYHLFAKEISRLKIPVFWIPGNHDDTEKMNETFGQYEYLKREDSFEKNNWCFLFIDTKLMDKKFGFLSEEALHSLQRNIGKINQEKKICLVMHHHPLPVNIPLIDHYILKNYRSLISLISHHEKVKLLLCGHVHGVYVIKNNEVELITCPATCFQFKKGDDNNIQAENKIGYNLFRFSDEGYIYKNILFDT